MTVAPSYGDVGSFQRNAHRLVGSGGLPGGYKGPVPVNRGVPRVTGSIRCAQWRGGLVLCCGIGHLWVCREIVNLYEFMRGAGFCNKSQTGRALIDVKRKRGYRPFASVLVVVFSVRCQRCPSGAIRGVLDVQSIITVNIMIHEPVRLHSQGRWRVKLGVQRGTALRVAVAGGQNSIGAGHAATHGKHV